MQLLNSVILRPMRANLIFSEKLSDVLGKEYQQRHAKNLAYSYRAFARDLAISVSQLSDVLRGRRGLSLETFTRISSFLRLTEVESEVLWSLTEREFSRSNRKREAANLRLSELRSTQSLRFLQNEEFAAISNWRHFALLELTRVLNQESDFKSLAAQLRINEDELASIVAALERLELISVDGNRIESQGNVAAVQGLPSSSVRQFHRDLIGMATEAIEGQSISERYLSSSINAVSESDLPKASEMIQEFVHKFNSQFAKTEDGEAVYALTIQHFRLLK